MKLYNLYEEVIFEEIAKNRKLLTEGVSDGEIIKAIDGRYNVNIKYRDPDSNTITDRYIQVYVFGKMKNGNYAIRAYQIDGGSTRGNKHDWKIFRIDRIENWEPTNMKWKTPVSMLDPTIGKYNSNGDNKWDFATKSVQATFTNIIAQIKELEPKKQGDKSNVIGKISNFDRNKSYPNIVSQPKNKDINKPVSAKEIPQPIERPIGDVNNKPIANKPTQPVNQLIDRDKGALDRLENQLNIGTKTEKNGTRKVPLTDEDRKRIENEINALKNK
jgi:hypothetical protein